MFVANRRNTEDAGRDRLKGHDRRHQIPENDKFQVITEHAPEEINVADSYLGNRYSGDVIVIQITLNVGRSVALKQALYRRLVDDIHRQLKMRREDVVINLVEVAKENWSFGGGIAQYVT